MTDEQPSTGTQPNADSQPQGQVETGSAPSRRAVIVGSGALGVTCLVAACADATTPAAPLPAGSAKASASGGSTVPPAGTKLAAVKDVPAGGALITDDYVVTQPVKDTFRAFSKVCTHLRCDVSEIKEDRIICRCHNSAFSIADGSVKGGPAKAPLAAIKVIADGDNVVTA